METLLNFLIPSLATPGVVKGQSLISYTTDKEGTCHPKGQLNGDNCGDYTRINRPAIESFIWHINFIATASGRHVDDNFNWPGAFHRVSR